MVAVAVGVILISLRLSVARVRDEAADLSAMGVWSVGLAVTVGVALFSLRSGPRSGRWAACLSLVVCLLGLGWVAVECAKALLP